MNDKIFERMQEGNWADFNCTYRARRELDRLAKKHSSFFKRICDEEVPEQLDVDDFPDLDDPRDDRCD